MMTTVEMLRPFGSIRVLSSSSMAHERILATFLPCAIARDSPTTVHFNLLSFNGKSSLKIRFEPILRQDEFSHLLAAAEPALFSRGHISYVTPDSGCILRVDVGQVRSGRPNDHSLALDVVSPREASDKEQGDMTLEGMTRRDVVRWSSIDESLLVISTGLGNRTGPPVTLRLCHVGADRVLKAQWEFEIFREECSPRTLVAMPRPLRHQLNIMDGRVQAQVSYWAAFGPRERRIRLYDRFTSFGAISGPLSACLTRIDSLFRPPIRNRLTHYLDIDLSAQTVAGPLGELPQDLLDELSSSVPSAIRDFMSRKGFQRFAEDARLRMIDEEERSLRRRKEQARQRNGVYLLRGGKLKLLYHVPQNEQDVVLLMSMLAQHNVIPEFSFIDYNTQRGIDCIARVRLTRKRATDDDAVVEFKFRLEDFLNELHPLSLVDIVVAWDVRTESFADSAYKLSGPVEGKKWLRRLTSRSDGSSADVVLLRHIEMLKLGRL